MILYNILSFILVGKGDGKVSQEDLENLAMLEEVGLSASSFIITVVTITTLLVEFLYWVLYRLSINFTMADSIKSYVAILMILQLLINMFATRGFIHDFNGTKTLVDKVVPNALSVISTLVMIYLVYLGVSA